MNGIANGFIDNTVQCWGCPIFDRLFRIVSTAAAAVYDRFTTICVILFCILFAFFVFNAVWQNLKEKTPDAWFSKSVQPVFINAIVVFTLLGMGVALPRFITRITIEPSAQIALTYTQALVKTDSDIVAAKVDYTPAPMPDDGFFTPTLRDTIIMLMKTTITQFQSYMKLGLAIIDGAFTWRALLGIGVLIKHILMLMVGMYIFYTFFRLFIRFCFYFADIIIAMAFFAFFFPLSLTMMAFQDAGSVPKWMSGIGKSLGVAQIKNLIGAIVALAAGVIIYTVIMVIVARFFTDSGVSTNVLMEKILSGDVFANDLSTSNLESMTLMGAIVLGYIVNFLADQIPGIKTMVLDTFGVQADNSLSEKLANDTEKLAKLAFDYAKRTGEKIIGRDDKKGNNKSADKKK